MGSHRGVVDYDRGEVGYVRAVGWIWCKNRGRAEEVCNKLIAVKARIINVAENNTGYIVWFEHERASDEVWVADVVDDTE